MVQYKDILDRIRDALKENPRGMTITEISSVINLNRNSTARYLDVLLISGQVELKQTGSAKVYFLSPRVPVEAVLDLSNDGILMFDSNRRIIRVNETFVALFGLDSDKTIGADFGNFELPIKKHNMLPSFIDKAMKGKQQTFEDEIKKQDDLIYVNIKLVPTTFDDGDIGVTMVVEDITGRKQSEKEILRQNEFLNLVMESVAHPFYVVNASNYTIEMANKAARLGFLPNESKCYALTHNSNQPCSGDVHPCPLQEVKATRMPVVVEHTHHTVSGKTKHLEIHAHPIFDGQGNVIQMIEYNLDVTERKELEEVLRNETSMYRSIIDSFNEGTLVTRDNLISFGSTKVSDLMGYDVEELKKLRMKDILDSKSMTKFRKLTSSATQIDPAFVDDELDLICRDGQSIPVLISVRSLGDTSENAFFCKITLKT